MCRPLDPIDFEVRDDLPETGWPISRSELDRLLRRGPARVPVGASSTTLLGGMIATARAHPSSTTGSSKPSSSRSVHRLGSGRPIEMSYGSPAVQILLHANAIEIETGDDTRTVTGVQLATLDGNRLRAEARAYVIATGGIEVPRLLLASNRARPAGLGNDHDLVGRFFMEHLVVETGVVPFPTPPDPLGRSTCPSAADSVERDTCLLRALTHRSDAPPHEDPASLRAALPDPLWAAARPAGRCPGGAGGRSTG